MNEEKIMAVIEAVLFAMGDSVELSKLQHVLEIPEEEIRGMIQLMNETYKRQDRGIYIMELENAVQLCTKPELYEYLIRVAKAPRKYVLSDTLLETLSIIAYKQPVTKLEVEKIRGVSSDHAVNKLLEFHLIQELGRRAGASAAVWHDRGVSQNLWREITRRSASLEPRSSGGL